MGRDAAIMRQAMWMTGAMVLVISDGVLGQPAVRIRALGAIPSIGLVVAAGSHGVDGIAGRVAAAGGTMEGGSR